MDGVVTAQRNTVAAIVAGPDVIPSCGDDRINLPGEQCRQLGGASCASVGLGGGAYKLAHGNMTFDTGRCRLSGRWPQL